MKRSIFRYLAVSLAAVLTVCLVSGCALPSPVPVDDSATAQLDLYNDSTATIDGEALINVTDMAGNAIKMDAYASRIVVLDAADCEILCAIGASEQIVGRSESCDYPDTINPIPYVTTEGIPSAELILELNPQVVVMNAKDAENADLLADLQAAGVQPVITDATSISDVYTAITLLGTIADHVAEAGSLVANMLTSFAELQEQTANNSLGTVYFELAPLADGLETAGSDTLLNDVATLLGMKNEFEDLAGYMAVSAEQVIGRNPDIIITTSPVVAESADVAEPTDDNTLSAVDEILKRPGWEGITAVVKQDVYAVDGDALSRPGPRLLDAVNALYELLYATPAELTY
jgi:iron complex transport system substrate-binding protein